MTVEDARKFIEKMNTDHAFFDSIKNAEPDARKGLLAVEGLNFTKDELDALIMEVSDEDLKTVSGGALNMPTKGASESRIPISPNQSGDMRAMAQYIFK